MLHQDIILRIVFVPLWCYREDTKNHGSMQSHLTCLTCSVHTFHISFRKELHLSFALSFIYETLSRPLDMRERERLTLTKCHLFWSCKLFLWRTCLMQILTYTDSNRPIPVMLLYQTKTLQSIQNSNFIWQFVFELLFFGVPDTWYYVWIIILIKNLANKPH